MVVRTYDKMVVWSFNKMAVWSFTKMAYSRIYAPFSVQMKWMCSKWRYLVTPITLDLTALVLVFRYSWTKRVSFQCSQQRALHGLQQHVPKLGQDTIRHIQGYSKWLSGYNCPAAIPHQIRETTTIWQFHSKVVCTVSRDRVRVYPGTEGKNQNRHWNHHRWHATNSLERTRLSCWCL